MGKIKKPYTVKKSKKVRTYEPVLPLYMIPYIIYIGETVKDAGDAAILELGPDIEPNITPNVGAKAMTIIHDEHGQGYFILLGIKSHPFLLAAAAHEALHLSWWMLEQIGLDIDSENHEAQTYIVQEIFQTTKEALEEYIKFYKLKTKL